MVRAEDGTVFGSIGAARTAECRVCGKPLRFKDNKVGEGANGVVTEAKHCGTIYTIGSTGQATISAARDPKFTEKENKILEKQQQANKLRRRGKTDEAVKLEDEVEKEYEDLAKEEDTEEPKTDMGGRREASREEEKSRGNRAKF